MKLSATEFIDLLIQKLDEITVHSFITQAQSAYLNNMKETISLDEAIVLGDFAENSLRECPHSSIYLYSVR